MKRNQMHNENDNSDTGSDTEVPKDHYNLVSISFFMFGLGGWIAWNASLTGMDYFNSRFKPEYNPSFVFGFVFTWPLFLGNFLLLYLADKISLSIKINISFVVILLCSFSMPFITEYLPTTASWYILLCIIFINGLANSFVQGGLFGFASIFPKKYIAVMMTSQALSAVILSFVKICCILILPPDNSKGSKDMNVFYNSLIYLSVGVIILIAGIFAYNSIYKLEFARYYIAQAHIQKDDEYSPNGSPAAATSILDDSPGKFSQINLKEKLNCTETDNEQNMLSSENDSSWLFLYKKVSFLGFQAFFVFFVTFVLYPGTFLATKFDFLNNNSSRESWFDISMLAMYAFIDFIGRWQANGWLPFNKNTLAYMTFGRLILIPTTVMIQLGGEPTWIFQSDWFRILNVGIFGWTQGYNTALVMMFGPQEVKPHQREKAGIIMNFHLMAGICFATGIAAFGMERIPQHSKYD